MTLRIEDQKLEKALININILYHLLHENVILQIAINIDKPTTG